jgi:LysM repeat protein
MAEINRRTFVLSMAGLALAAPFGWEALAATRTHTVRKGDTLSSLAQRYGVSVGELRAANGIEGSLIRIGQKLTIPAPDSVVAPVIAANRTIRLNLPKWKYIVGHHSATDQGSARSFDQSNRKAGMKNGLAYHFVIGNGKGSPDGAIEVGDRWKRQLHGGHVSKWEFNNHGIGICLVGNFEKTRPTAKQLQSFETLVTYLGGTLLNNRFKFYVHREINATLCPGRFFPTQAMHRKFG